MKVLVPAILFVFGLSANANCVCMCIDGAARTVCSEIDEAQANPSACLSAYQCPQVTDVPTGDSYVAPVEGAVHCRDAFAWNNNTKEYGTPLKVCDVVEAETQGES